MMPEKIILSWSGGKDSSMTLHEIYRSQDYEVSALLTTLTEGYDRISMHGVRRELLERQAVSLGLQLHEIYISRNATNDEYESKMMQALVSYQEAGINAIAFGDLFLEEVRQYRVNNLNKIGMNGLFPLWNKDTAKLIREFIDLGFKAIVTCVDPKLLDPSFVGEIIDDEFLRLLPSQADPCGENGEFHSFVFDGPIFKEKINFSVGEVALRDSFWFCDLLLS
jgi:uncharacterized protein (TIGR00290 family)